MKDKILFYKFFRRMDKKEKNYMYDQNKESIEYNINMIKNEIIKNSRGVTNER